MSDKNPKILKALALCVVFTISIVLTFQVAWKVGADQSDKTCIPLLKEIDEDRDSCIAELETCIDAVESLLLICKDDLDFWNETLNSDNNFPNFGSCSIFGPFEEKTIKHDYGKFGGVQDVKCYRCMEDEDSDWWCPV